MPALLFRPPPPVPGGRHGFPNPDVVRHLTAGLSEEDARILREALSPGPEAEEFRSRLREERARLDAIVGTEPFDAAAFRAVLDDGTERRSRAELRQHAVLAEALARISPAGRQAVARAPKPPPFEGPPGPAPGR